MTEELATAIRSGAVSLDEARGLAAELADHASELSQEANAHGWHGMGQAMESVAEALLVVVELAESAQESCESAAETLEQINDSVPATDLVFVSTSQAFSSGWLNTGQPRTARQSRQIP